jgi:hypothetical protein
VLKTHSNGQNKFFIVIILFTLYELNYLYNLHYSAFSKAAIEFIISRI